jgi:N-acetylmuramoyl-L-alanine amidase
VRQASKAIPQIIRRSVLLLLGGTGVLIAQNSIPVQFESDPSKNSSIGTFRRQEILYGSLHDLADVFGLSTFENRAANKFELKQPPYRVKVSDGNPFVAIIDHTQRQTVHQLPANVIHAAGKYFVPLQFFVPFLDVVFNKRAVFDAGNNMLRVTGPVGTTGFDITTLRLEPKSNGMLIRIPTLKEFRDYECWMRQDGWLYVTIADARVHVEAINKLKPAGMVKRIVAIQSPTSVQLTFKLSGKVAASEIVKDDHSSDLLLSIRTPGAEEKVLLESKRREIQAGLEQQRNRWKLDVIVLDAGHGGRDFGAIGVSGAREKDITLGITLKLGKLIEKHLPGVRVVHTRKDDRFVELDRRGQIANEAEGKLFISIHANSLKKKPSNLRGFEVYLLRPGRTEEAVAIAERENSVIQLEEGYEERYQELTEENFILVTMAQSAHVRASEMFADVAQQEMEDHLSIPNRGVKQAGFLVLVGASMPNVLVETAYLSNREDERFLKSEDGQKKIAEALFKAIKRYKTEYEKLLQEGASIGAN